MCLNFDDENTKVSDTITMDCEKDPMENKFPWDSDVDFVCTPVTARKLRRVKRMLWKIDRNPDGTITALKNSNEIKTKKQDEVT